MSLIRRKDPGQAWETEVDTGGSGGGVQMGSSVLVAAAELLTLTASPVTVVEAQGAGTMIVPLFASYSYHAGATPYTIPGGAFLTVTPTPTASFGGPFQCEAPAAGLLDQASDTAVFCLVAGLASANYTDPLDPSDYDNVPLVVTNDRPGEYTDGDGTLVVGVVYQVVSI